jgi:aminomethyltransferase
MLPAADGLPATTLNGKGSSEKYEKLIIETISKPQMDSQPSLDLVHQPSPEPSPCLKPQQQPLCEPSPLLKMQPDPVLDHQHVRVPSDAESEPASEPSVGRTVHKTLPPALASTMLAGLRFRKSCYFDATLRWGVQKFAPYNHMLLPILYSSTEDEYHSLRNDVCLWDVAAERQIEVAGEDATQLVELLTPRKLGSMKVGEARYAIMTDEQGMVINDPVVLRVGDAKYWFSIADSDMLFWIKGLALGRGLNVKVTEPDVSPLAVQGPKSLPLMKELFGDWVEDLKSFQFRATDLDGIPMLLCRSGWSPERGYELFLMDGSRGDELWEKVMAAGQKYSIKPGCPNHIRRIEGGMLSFGNDVSPQNSILELGLPEKWCFTDKPEFLGKAAIKELSESGGPKQKVVGLEFEKTAVEDRNVGPLMKPWDVLAVDNEGKTVVVGWVTSVVFSPAMETHLAIATVSAEMSSAATEVLVDTAVGDRRSAFVRKLPFMPRAG